MTSDQAISFLKVIELAKRVEAEWGKFNDTEVDDSDSPNWGFENFRKLGRVALGIAKQELRNLPIRGIEDVIDALGKQKDWDRGQVCYLLARIYLTIIARTRVGYELLN